MLSLPVLFAVMLLPGVCMLATSMIVSLFERHNDNLTRSEQAVNS